MNLSLTRRRFLQGLGMGAGAALLSPLMRQVWAQSQGMMPRRFVFVVAGNGIETGSFMSPTVREAINAAGGSITPTQRYHHYASYKNETARVLEMPDLASAFALSPLAGANGERELVSRSKVLFGLSSLVAGGGHTSNYGAMSSSRANGDVPVAPTIDKVLALQTQVRQQTPFDVLRLGMVQDKEATLQYALLAHAASKPAPLIVSPTLTYNTLFGSIANAAGRQQFLNRAELLDLARNDVQRGLNALPSSAMERVKLETCLASIEQLRSQQQILLDSEDELRRVDTGGPDANPGYTDDCPLLRLEAQGELATAALLGGLTNVAVIASSGSLGMHYKSLAPLFAGDPEGRGVIDRHKVCHESGGIPAYVEILQTVTRRHVELIAKMARTLDAVPEGDGTMLDHTAIVFLSDNGDEHHSISREWPVLVVGGEKLGLKTGGQAVVYPRYDHDNNRQMSNLFNTLGYAAGMELDDFGLEATSRKAEGPLSELFG